MLGLQITRGIVVPILKVRPCLACLDQLVRMMIYSPQHHVADDNLVTVVQFATKTSIDDEMNENLLTCNRCTDATVLDDTLMMIMMMMHMTPGVVSSNVVMLSNIDFG